MYISLNDLPEALAQGSAVTIGNFDGLHLGHQRLIEQTVNKAQTAGLRSVVITFEPHPLRVMLGDAAPPLLMPLARKFACIKSLGVDYILVLPFTREIATTTPEDFVQNILVQALRTRHLFVGYDYAFGKGRRGNAELLKSLGASGTATERFEVTQIPPVFAENNIVSSTRIREEIRAGNVDEATRLLGRPHTVEGIVTHGMKRGGALLGFPTANLHLEDNLLLPRVGVYAVLAELSPHEVAIIPQTNGRELTASAGIMCCNTVTGVVSEWIAETAACLPGRIVKGVASVGYNPTFNDAGLRVETHLLDYKGNLYDKPLRIYFIYRLRDEQKFTGVEALKAQISRDVLQARDILS